MRIETIPLYNDRDYVTLTAFLWKDSGEMLAGKKRPALLICPGGAYLTCSDREAEPIAMKFVSMGYDAFVLRYSTYCEGDTRFPDLSKPLKIKKHVQYPTAMREIGMAMLLIHEHADEWLVDADKITICGFSAGGHNVAMYGTHWNQPVIQDYFENRGMDLRPAAMLLGYTMSDFIYMKEDNIASRVALFEGTNKGLLGVENPDDATRVAMSPALLVNADTPPTFLWGTYTDDLVPVQHTMHMANALADHQIPFELHIFEEGPHGLALSTQATAGAKSQIYPAVEKWTEMARIWMEKRFSLDLDDFTEFERMMRGIKEKDNG